MSMQMYVNAACEAQRRDPVGYANYFGDEGYDDDYVDDEPIAEAEDPRATSEIVADVIGQAGRALSGNFTLARLHASTVEDSDVRPADISPGWRKALVNLDDAERGVLTGALAIPVHDLGIKTVAMVRRLPATELLKAKGIGEGRAKVLKALGHNADRETELVLVVDADRHEEVLKPGALEGSAS